MARQFRPDRETIQRVIVALDAAAAEDDGYGDWLTGVLPRVGALVRNGRPIADIAKIIRGAGLPLSDSSLRRFLHDAPTRLAVVGKPMTAIDSDGRKLAATDDDRPAMAAADPVMTEIDSCMLDVTMPTLASPAVTATASWMDDAPVQTTDAPLVVAACPEPPTSLADDAVVLDDRTAEMARRFRERQAAKLAAASSSGDGVPT